MVLRSIGMYDEFYKDKVALYYKMYEVVCLF